MESILIMVYFHRFKFFLLSLLLLSFLMPPPCILYANSEQQPEEEAYVNSIFDNMENNNASKTIMAAKSLYEKFPKNPLGYKILISVFASRNDPLSILGLLNAALAAGIKEKWVYEKKAEMLYALGDLFPAIDLLREMETGIRQGKIK